MEGVKTEAALVVSNDRREEKATTKSKEMISTKKGFLLKKQLFTPMLWFSSCKYTGAQFYTKETQNQRNNAETRIKITLKA